MRIATYNVEWFDHLFDDDGAMVDNLSWSGRFNITKADQLAGLGAVFTALDADVWMIIEAPDCSRRRDGVKALEAFARHFGLRACKALVGYPNDTQQEIALLYDPDVVTAVHDPKGRDPDAPLDGGDPDEVPRFDGEFRLDVDVDASPDPIRWSKPPLEVALTPTSGGPTLRLIGVHAKSKAPHGARNKAEVMRLSIDNRRKQLAQCIWLRQRVVSHLEIGDPIIVLGDFNDGPGLDEYEKLFGRSGVEVVLGEGNGTQLFDPHARQALSQRIGVMPVTARFQLPPEGRFLSALLDYVMVSADIRATSPVWRIWHPFDDPECFENAVLREALLVASDHFPVSLDLEPAKLGLGETG